MRGSGATWRLARTWSDDRPNRRDRSVPRCRRPGSPRLPGTHETHRGAVRATWPRLRLSHATASVPQRRGTGGRRPRMRVDPGTRTPRRHRPDASATGWRAGFPPCRRAGKTVPGHGHRHAPLRRGSLWRRQIDDMRRSRGCDERCDNPTDRHQPRQGLAAPLPAPLTVAAGLTVDSRWIAIPSPTCLCGAPLGNGDHGGSNDIASALSTLRPRRRSPAQRKSRRSKGGQRERAPGFD